MIRRFPLLRPSVRSRRAGFTLIELLTVIAIILVLAGLLLNVAGNANYKSSVARAQAEVKAMETALESYKADNGTYPRSTDTDSLNAQPTSGGAPPDSTTYYAAGKILYEALSGTPATGSTTYLKKYMEFKPGQLGDASGSSLATGTTNPGGNTVVVDPFGMAYGYSTANQKAQDTANSTSPPGTVATTAGYNPTFDLWSCAGYGNGGKNYTKTGLATTAYNTLWAKNW